MIEYVELYSFYKLIDPRDTLPFYVGITTSVKERRRAHEIGRPHSRPLARRMKELEEAGLQSIMEEIEQKECTRTEALEREAYWIQFYEGQGIPLLNRSNNKGRRKPLTIYLLH